MVSQGLRAGVPTQVHQHNRHTILGGGGPHQGGCACGSGAHGKSLYLSFHFTVNLKLI